MELWAGMTFVKSAVLLQDANASVCVVGTVQCLNFSERDTLHFY